MVRQCQWQYVGTAVHSEFMVVSVILLLMDEMGDTDGQADTCLYVELCWGGVNHFPSELKVPAVTFQTVQYGWSQKTCFIQIFYVLAVLTIYRINIVTISKYHIVLSLTL